MRRKLSQECQKRFRKMMASQFPQYREDKTQTVPTGWHVWTWRQSTNLYFYIILVIDPSDDEFTVEAGWDRHGQLPEFQLTYQETEIIGKPSHFRPAFLWTLDHSDRWWSLVANPELREADFMHEDSIEDCLEYLNPAIEDLVLKLKNFVVPLFERVAIINRCQ